jgi:hypothetical protein
MTCLGVSALDDNTSSLWSRLLGYYADGDVMCGIRRSNFSDGSPSYEPGQVVSMQLDVNVTGYAEKAYVFQEDYNLAVTFFREGKLVRQPFLVKMPLDALQIAVYLCSLTSAELVPAPPT